MTIESEIRALTNDEGFLQPRSVVDWARVHVESALHDQFEWDDAKAADAHRVHQARRLIAIHVVADDGRRATISLVQDRTIDGGYRHLDSVMSNKELRAMALRQALRELKRVQATYRYLDELAEVFAATDKVVIPPSEVDGKAA